MDRVGDAKDFAWRRCFLGSLQIDYPPRHAQLAQSLGDLFISLLSCSTSPSLQPFFVAVAVVRFLEAEQVKLTDGIRE